ncbi:PIN domain-containing protein [Candidatus Woesearchaeota archaeon]|nr:PIN domain-containing protein [Candidatus Woesearchaeota archaeon]
MIKKVIIVDSDLIIDLLRGIKEAEEFFEKVKSREYIANFSTITETEIFSGKTSSMPHEKIIIDTLLNLMNRIDIDKDVARKAGELRREFGCGIPDAIISASAIINRIQIIATRNKKHFEMIKDVNVFTPY